MSVITSKQHVDPPIDSPPKPYQPLDYAWISLVALSLIFTIAMAINWSMMDGTTTETCAVKYAFDADVIQQAVGSLEKTALATGLVTIGGYHVIAAILLLLLTQEKICRKSLLFDPEMQKHPSEKPHAMMAIAIASIGIAILLSTVLIQYCPGMQALNDYYAGCEKSGYAMCAVDMRSIYESMDRLAGWNSYWDVMVVTGTALAAIGAMSFWHLQRRKNKEPETIPLDAIRGHDVSN